MADADGSDWESDMMEDFENDHGRVIHVQGSGLDVVNGEYRKSGIFDDVARYSKHECWKGQIQEFMLFRSGLFGSGTSTSSNKCWYMFSRSIPEEPDTDGNYFYSAPASEENPDYPPSHGWEMKAHGIAPAPTVSVHLAATYKGMLFCEDFSDVKIVCQDGVSVPAHKAILAASSPYFKAAFTGPWRGNESGELTTTHPSRIIEAMLTMIYTGDIDRELMNEEPLAFMSVASEYNLPFLKAVAQPICIRSLDATNLKDIWQAGRLYESQVLKEGCIKFVKKNPLVILVNGNFSRLQTEDPASWDEFVSRSSEDSTE